LYVAQKEYEFVHNDLHKKNILLVVPSDKNEYSLFRDEDCTWFTTGLFVKITDFGLSRIRLDNCRVLYNKKDPKPKDFRRTKIWRRFSEISKRICSVKFLRKVGRLSRRSKRKRVPEKRGKRQKRLSRNEKKKDWDLLRREARNFGVLKNLLRHEFFKELTKKNPISRLR